MKNKRGTIVVEDARILLHQAYCGKQHILRVQAPNITGLARPGSFVHVRCDESLPMRRPMSIMRVSTQEGWLEMLYKQVGPGTKALASRSEGEVLNLIGPIGVPFKVDNTTTRPLLLGGGVGIPPMLFLADSLRHRLDEIEPLVLMGSEVAFPFELNRSATPLTGIPNEVDKSLALTDSWEIPSRLCSLAGFPGCFEGYISDLARLWLNALSSHARDEVAIFACGPTPMLKAVAALAVEFSLPCQVSLEEHMACAVGGCAGCTVRVKTTEGEAMKRVCVDGPVFEAGKVFFDTSLSERQ